MISILTGINQKLLSKIQNKTEESCGFLLGRSIDNVEKVDFFIPVENNSDGDKSKLFEISAKDYLHTERYADQQGLKFIGVYHTHINQPAIPSELDKKFAFPEFYYIIFSMVNFAFSEVRCWKINHQGMFKEEKIKYSL